MKKLLTAAMLAALALGAATLASCKKDDPKGPEGPVEPAAGWNNFAIGGKTRTTASGGTAYYGAVTATFKEVEMAFFDADHNYVLKFGMLISPDSDRLAAGTYTAATTDEDFTAGTFQAVDFSYAYPETDGYAENINGGTAKGSYRGTLPYTDYSPT